MVQIRHLSPSMPKYPHKHYPWKFGENKSNNNVDKANKANLLHNLLSRTENARDIA